MDRVLAEDPAKAYSRMDFDSRDRYRNAVGELAKHCPRSELEVAQAAIVLCRQAQGDFGRFPCHGRAARTWATTWWIRVWLNWNPQLNIGRPCGPALRAWCLDIPPASTWRRSNCSHSLIVFAMLSGLNSLTPIFAGLVLLLLPATQGRGGVHQQPGGFPGEARVPFPSWTYPMAFPTTA